METSPIVSVLTGLITYVFVQFLVLVFNKVIIPWYQSIVYRGRNIEGEWVGYSAKKEGRAYVREKTPRSTIHLVQKGHKITGEILVTKQPSGKATRKLFTVDGLFYDNNLIITLRVKDKRRIGGGTCVMRLTEDGKKLKGKHSYVSSYDEATISKDEVWIRGNLVTKEE